MTWEAVWPPYLGIESGRYVLIDAQGGQFPLPVYGALDEGPLESADALHQAPGSEGAMRAGFGGFKPITLDFGTSAAGLDNWLEFDSEADAIAWERAYKVAARRAVRIRDAVAGEEYDGWPSRVSVGKYRYTTWRKVGLTFQSLDSHGWSPHVREVAGSPAVCPNAGLMAAYPLVTCTATAADVTVSDGTRALTVHTTPGHPITVDTGRADGLVSDNGGRANYEGRFPRIGGGGGTLTVTGAASVLVRYREPI